MLEKKLLKTSTSYSQFMQSKNPEIHCVSEPAASSVDIDFFRRSVSLHYQHVYASKKWQNTFYRLIFYGFSFLFFLLGLIIFFKSTNPVCGLYLGNCSIIKNWVNFLCVLPASGSFTLGYKIHPEKEAIKYLVKKVENELSGPAKQIQIEFSAIVSNLSHHLIEPNQAIWIKKMIK